MRILIVAPYCSLPEEPYFNRFLQLAEMLCERHEVILVTSRFRHHDKSMRLSFDQRRAQKIERFSIVLIDEPGYVSNVSLRRVYSHGVFFKNFKLWFEATWIESRVDVIYSAYPLISTNIYLGRIKKKYGFKLFLDVQDVWPESIASVLPVLRHVNPRLLPFSSKADDAYRGADFLLAVSHTYMRRAKLVNSRAASKVVYIGCDRAQLDAAHIHKFEDQFLNFVYIGTLSHSYDLKTVVKGFAKIWRDDRIKAFLHILGDGPDRGSLEEISTPNIKFYGFLKYSEMLSFLKGADGCINALSVGAQQTITNKFCDYALSGKCIINSQTNAEVLRVLENFSHVNYAAGSVDSFVDAIDQSISAPPVSMKANVLREFDRSVSYPALIDFIEYHGR